MGWWDAAHRGKARLLQVQTWLPDPGEHRRRVEARQADMPGQQVPSWEQVEGQRWVPWEAERDGPCTRINTSDSGRALAALLDLVDRP
jgi:hypothetical protein